MTLVKIGDNTYQQGDTPQDEARMHVTRNALIAVASTVFSIAGLGTIGVPLLSIVGIGTVALQLSGVILIAWDHVDSQEEWDNQDKLTEVIEGSERSNQRVFATHITATIDPNLTPIVDLVPNVQPREIVQVAVKPTFSSASLAKTVIEVSTPIIPSVTVIESQKDDFIEYMSSNLKSTLIVGIPGAGKGLTTKILISEIRKKHPGIYIMGVDPKFAKEGKEDGYWEENRVDGYDKAYRFRMSELGQEKGLNQITKCIAEFKAIEGMKLLIMDEGLVVAHTIKSNKFELENFISWMVYLTSMGDSEGEYMYFLSQSGSLAELNFPSSVRNCMDVLVLAKPGNDALITGILRTDLIAQGKASSIQSLKSVMERSEVKRAFYHNIYGEWLPTKRLKNFSSYDRDSRSFIGATVNVKTQPVSDVKTMYDRALHQATKSKDITTFMELQKMKSDLDNPMVISRLESICLAAI